MANLELPPGYALVTGGAGFIGTNLVSRLASEGTPVVVLDNFSGAGGAENAAWLQASFPRHVRVVPRDFRSQELLPSLVRGASQVFHLAAQVAVTTSLSFPREDFAINAQGTLQLLEAIRGLPVYPPLVFTSSNKVYGALADLELRRTETRYEPKDRALRERGIPEERGLEFHSPQGCSKGAADQYVLNYARCYGLRNVVFRTSSIYGPHQRGNEDQGWVAHFMLRILRGQPVTIYGDGRQVRDLLFVDDLVDALLSARDRADTLAGTAFNIGGGPENTVSVQELLRSIAALVGHLPEVDYQPARAGDQRYFAADVSRFHAASGWRPQVSSRLGLSLLLSWLVRNSGGELGIDARLASAPNCGGDGGPATA